MRDSRTLLLALTPPFCFGASFTLAKPAVAHFPPLLMMLFAYGFIAVVTLFTVREKITLPPVKAFLTAACCVTIQGALLFWAVRSLEATTANLLLQTQVPAAVFMGWLMLGEQLTLPKMFGTAVAILGAVIIIGLPQEKPPLIPVIMIVASGLVWALGQTLVRKWGTGTGLLALKANALYGVPQLVLATWLLESGQWQAITSATPLQWLNLAFVVVVGFYIAYVAWFSLLRRVPLEDAAPFILLMTPIGLAVAVLALGETMTMVQFTGAAVLMLGLMIVNGVVPLPGSIRAR